MADESRPDFLSPDADEALGRFWNALGQGDSPDSSDVDPGLVDIVQHVRHLGAAQAPEPAFVQRLRGELFATGPNATVPTRPEDGFQLNGRAAYPMRQPGLAAASIQPDRRWRYAAGAFVTLLLGLGLGYIVFGSSLFDDDERMIIPAAVAPTATPTPGVVSDETVLQYSIPAAEMPQVNIGMGTTRNTIEPGNRSTWTPHCCPGPMLEYVIAGTYTIRAEAAVQVVRADGTSESVPAGVEVTLGAGDALISRNETVVEAANTGSDMVQLINWTLVEAQGFAGHLLAGWTNNDPDVQGAESLGTGPATVTLRRLELSPGAVLPAQTYGEFQFTVPMPLADLAGTPVPSLTVPESDGTIRIGGKGTVTIYVLTLEPSGVATGTPDAESPTP